MKLLCRTLATKSHLINLMLLAREITVSLNFKCKLDFLTKETLEITPRKSPKK